MKTRLVVPALALGVAGLLAACQPGETGAAAVVGNDRLSEAKVQSDTKATIAALGPTASTGVDTGAILDTTVQRFVHHELLIRAAKQQGIGVTKGEVDTLIAQSSQGEGGLTGLQQQAAQQASVPPAELDDYAHDYLLEGKLGVKLAPGGTPDQQQSAVLAFFQKVGKQARISVSPRYGRYDLSTLRVLSSPDDLSKPTGTATPSASTTP